jgi:predicted metal-dependent hydrolase
METIEINIPPVGQVLFERSKKAKRLIISVRSRKGIRVAIPRGVNLESAKKFTLSKVDWIIRQQEKMGQMERKKEALLDDTVTFTPLEARKILSDRVNTLASRYGFTFGRVTIRNQKTRWGSCSEQNNINLNINLVRLPPHLRDYVILHELLHTRIKNHSQTFWETLEAYVQDAKLLGKVLKNYSPLLHR